MNVLRRILWTVVLICLAITWLPYFGILNTPDMIGPFPRPLAVTLGCNVTLTLCTILIYPLYFRPFIKTLRAHPIERAPDHD